MLSWQKTVGDQKIHYIENVDNGWQSNGNFRVGDHIDQTGLAWEQQGCPVFAETMEGNPARWQGYSPYPTQPMTDHTMWRLPALGQVLYCQC